MPPAVDPIDALLSTLNATDVGSLDSIADKFRQVAADLRGMQQDELATRSDEAVAALGRGDIAEFKRLRAFIQSKAGHLRR
jgi:hypothetical protein